MTEEVAPLTVTEQDRDDFEDVATALIPGGSGLPSAREVRAGRRELDRLLAARPDLAREVLGVVRVTQGDPAMVAEFREQDPEAFQDFAVAVAATYLMNVEVRRALGYEGIAPVKEPPHPGEAEYYLDEGLVEDVKERGPIYREVP